LDQNVGAPEAPYRRRAADTQLLLGTHYALLRRAYLEWPAQSGWQREIPAQARKLLVTLGGADPHNTTAKIIQALAYVSAADLAVKVVIGAANPHAEALRAAAAECPHAVELVTGAGELVELMAWADAIVVPGSVTCWEALFMGVPPLLPILVDNQGASAARLEELGVGVNLGWHHALDPEAVAAAITAVLNDPVRRAEMSARGRELVDGQGAQRVRAAMDTWSLR
jgi:spore coat polysaccharide biosynthesis predicted glycosyltransferase SpsG